MMIHFALPCTAAPAVPLILRPVTPASYLRLRRTAAGLSRTEVAIRLASKACDVGIATSLIRSLETEGVTARQRTTLMRLSAIFAFDPDVYRQLADEPPHRHPSICRMCGATAFDRAVAAGSECGGGDGECMQPLCGILS